MQEIIQKALSGFLNANQFSIQTLSAGIPVNGLTQVGGVMSLFGHEITFETKIRSTNTIHSFEAEFPASASLNISNLDRMAGGNLSNRLPQGFPDAGRRSGA